MFFYHTVVVLFINCAEGKPVSGRSVFIYVPKENFVSGEASDNVVIRREGQQGNSCIRINDGEFLRCSFFPFVFSEFCA